MGNWGYSITPMSGVISPFMTWGPPCRSSHLSKKYLDRQRWTFCSPLNHFCRQGQQTQVHLTRTFCDVDSCPCSNSDSIKSNIPLLHGDHLIFRNVSNLGCTASGPKKFHCFSRLSSVRRRTKLRMPVTKRRNAFLCNIDTHRLAKACSKTEMSIVDVAFWPKV